MLGWVGGYQCHSFLRFKGSSKEGSERGSVWSLTDVEGAHWVPLNKRGSQADTGLVRNQILEESSSLASPGKPEEESF